MILDQVLLNLQGSSLTSQTLGHTLIQDAFIQMPIYFHYLYLSNSNDSYTFLKGCATNWKTILNRQCLSVLSYKGLEDRQCQFN